MDYLFSVLLSVIICYLFGSISFAIIISKAVSNDDVRNHGSGNAGMTNVIRTVGLKAGLITFVGDVAKGVAGILLTRFLIILPSYNANIDAVSKYFTPEFVTYFCAIACMLGHVFPIFFQFKGGKGVATAIGVLYCINWQAATFVLLTFLVLLIITKIVSIGSVMGAFEWMLYVFLFTANESWDIRLYTTALAAVLSAIVIIKHKDNIIRLHNGEEKAIKSKK